jgi:hypothetical protein
MDTNERQLIDGLFGKLRQVDAQAPARDADAEALIRQHVGQNPAAPYYMAQAILVQERALEAAQSRVQALEQQAAQAPAGGGSFLGSLFGSSAPAPAAPASRSRIPPTAPMGGGFGAGYAPRGPWGGGGGGGFLAGAAQTALGVAGGMLVADAIGNMFSSGTAHAADMLPADDVPADDPGADDPGADDAGYEDAGFDGGGDFGSDEL